MMSMSKSSRSKRVSESQQSRSSAITDSMLSERSALLVALRSTSTSCEGTYMTVPPSTGGCSVDAGQFRPITYAEKALAALLNGVLLYALGAIVGLLLVALNFEGMLGAHILNWWLIFTPFWVANLALLIAHGLSLRHARKLRQWAEVETMSNEPLLPLLRRILVIYMVSFPLMVLLLWSELAFCARLADPGTSLYVCYAPLMVIQVAFFIRYLLCQSDSTLPGICWVLAFVFTLLLAYQTNNHHIVHTFTGGEIFPLSWWTVVAPLFVLEAVFVVALIIVLYYEFTGVYRMTRSQLAASALYFLALVMAVTGELMLLKHVDFHWGSGTFTFPTALLFAGLLCASIAIYIIGNQYVQELMETKGGAVPVPLTRTSEGWVTSHAVTDHWSLFGDIALTPDGLNARNQMMGRRQSIADMDIPLWKRTWHRIRGCLGCGSASGMLTPSDPERRILNIRERRTSGSYSDIKIDLDTPHS